MAENAVRMEKDFLGERSLPASALWGIHSLRARENFPLPANPVNPRLVHALGEVKLACAQVNHKLGYLEDARAKAVMQACRELADGALDEHIIVPALQGGAGTSLNHNVNEVIANRSLVLMGRQPGEYAHCDPLEDVNRHQSTNDVFPTALRVAAYRALAELEQAVTGLQEALQRRERELDTVPKLGRTELMDAVPVTLGREFGAWAEAIARDRWRLFKCQERIRVVNLGGTAVGTGLGAPKEYIFLAAETLKQITGLPLARAENLLEATQNQDALAEVMGMVKTHALNLLKMARDLRLLAMGPAGGPAEIKLQPLQGGSTLMPGKTNPVIPEMVCQVAFQVVAADAALTWAVGSGELELNAFLPAAADNLLRSLDLLIAANRAAADKCIGLLAADPAQCGRHLAAAPSAVTVLVPEIGYHRAEAIAQTMREQGLDLLQACEQAGVPAERVRQRLSPQAVNALGSEPAPKQGNRP